MKKTLLILPIIFALSGCVSVGTKVDTTKVASFEKGKTTYSDVVSALGAPQMVGTQSDGKKTLSYYYSSSTPNAAAFIPIVGLFAGKTKGELTMVRFVFDADNKMESFTHDESHTTVSIGGVKSDNN